MQETSVLTLLNQIGVPAIVLLLLLREIPSFVAAIRKNGPPHDLDAPEQVVQIRDLWYGRREMTAALTSLTMTASQQADTMAKQTEILREITGALRSVETRLAGCPHRVGTG